MVIRTPDRDALVAAVGAACGLPALDGYRPGGNLLSTGVRFSNGPFLDVFQAEAAAPVQLGLGGVVDEVEALAAEKAWGFVTARRAAVTDPAELFPWDMGLFRRKQGLLSRLFVIEYAPDGEAWAPVDFQGRLYRRDAPPAVGARLARVWLAAEEVARAASDLQALGFVAHGPVRSAHPPYDGQGFTGPNGDIVLCEGADGVPRLDVAREGELAVLELTPGLTMVVGEV